MARFSIAGRSSVAPTAVRAAASLFAVSGRTMKVREVGVFNTTATAAAIGLCRFTNATGVGAGLTEVLWDEQGPAANGTGFAGHTSDGAVGALIRAVSLPAAAGGGVIWTFGDTGLIVAAGTANGVGIICPTGTGQIVDYYIDWDE